MLLYFFNGALLLHPFLFPKVIKCIKCVHIYVNCLKMACTLNNLFFRH